MDGEDDRGVVVVDAEWMVRMIMVLMQNGW
jgi:hypothetical protein